MSSCNRPLIEPTTIEQRQKEKEISDQLQAAESETVREILSHSLTPSGLEDIIKNANSFAEEMTQKFRHKDTPPVKCKESCCWCCFQNVLVLAPEVFRIARFIQNDTNFHIQEKVIKHLRSLSRRIYRCTSTERSNLHLPCAFLQNDRCMIYPVRPLSCAEFASFNVQDCKRGYNLGFGPEDIIHEKARLIVYRAVHKGLLEGLIAMLNKSDNIPLELTVAVIAALDNSDSEEAWIRGDDIFSNAHLIKETIESDNF
jgi:Fe-S-cluster containining protein